MLRRIAVLLALALVATAFAPVAASDSLHVARSVFTAEKNKQKHPEALMQSMTISRDVPDPRICITYENSSKKSQGWAVVNILLTRAEGTEEVIELSNQVTRNKFVRCTKEGQIEPLAEGDVFVFDWAFSNMLRLHRSGDKIDWVIANAVAVANGFPLYVEEVGVAPGEEEDGKQGGWLHSSNFNAQASKNKQKHPPTVTRMLVVGQNTEAPNVCALYRNTFNKGGKGVVKTTVSFYRGDEMIESFTFTNKVKKNTARECRIGPELMTDDMVVFENQFTKMPRMKMKGDNVDYFEITAAIADSFEAAFVQPPGDSPGPSDPGPDAPPPSAGFTSADLAAVAKVLYGGRPTQLWRPKASWGETKWMIIGPGTQLGSDNGGINRATVGYGNTLAAAVADYERKRGKLSAASKGLSNADIEALKWYAAINNSGGPTSIRMPRNSGAFVAEFFRPGKGVQHQNFSSFVAAINYLKSQGL